MAQIQKGNYNAARDILIAAGSDTAEKSHPKHGSGSCPEGHGQSLLREARDEFRDSAKNVHRSEMDYAQYEAVHKAASKMSISHW